MPCAAAGFETKAETPKSCHGEWRSSEQRSGSEALGDIKQGWRSEKLINSQFHTSDMTSIPGSPSLITPTADNVQMDVDSDSEAEQAAREFAQAQERLCIANEARERHWEERKRKEEEEKEAQWITAIEAATKKAEEILERERQAQLQVSTGVLWNSTCTKFVTQRDLEVSVMTLEPLLVPFTDKGKEVSTRVDSGFDTGTENRNR